MDCKGMSDSEVFRSEIWHCTFMDSQAIDKLQGQLQNRINHVIRRKIFNCARRDLACLQIHGKRINYETRCETGRRRR